MAVVAVGTGNDWVRTFGISNRYQDAVKAISEGYSFLQDVGVVSYEESHYRQSRYMANVAGAGFDAHVVRKLSHLKKKGHRSRWRYTWCLVKNFFRYKSTGIKVWVDDRLVYNNLLLSAAIGICKFNGGGIQQLPAAVADDGMLDLSLIRPVHFWHLLFRWDIRRSNFRSSIKPSVSSWRAISTNAAPVRGNRSHKWGSRPDLSEKETGPKGGGKRM